MPLGWPLIMQNITSSQNVLRYYGDAADIGLVATYEANDKNKVELRLNRYTEDLVRGMLHSDSDLEPQQHFKRTADRNIVLTCNGP